ncbi:hypothetical protein ACOJIV_25455 [Haloarcula sp. AONF1]
MGKSRRLGVRLAVGEPLASLADAPYGEDSRSVGLSGQAVRPARACEAALRPSSTREGRGERSESANREAGEV